MINIKKSKCMHLSLKVSWLIPLNFIKASQDSLEVTSCLKIFGCGKDFWSGREVMTYLPEVSCLFFSEAQMW